jgi:hypothetical protein
MRGDQWRARTMDSDMAVAVSGKWEGASDD